MKKIGLLCLALVLALGTLGIGYATWSANVTIEQTVKTGDLMVGVVDVGTNDEGESDDPGTVGTDDPKHVATCNSTNHDLICGCVCGETQYYEKVVETITNGYPCYTCNTTIQFASCGSIPAKLKSIVTTDDGNDLCPFIELQAYAITGPDGNPVAASGTDWIALETDLKTLQLHECDNVTVVLQKHIKQDVGDDECPQGANCTITHEFKWVQFNKVDE
jgi:hypothetical protein